MSRIASRLQQELDPKLALMVYKEREYGEYYVEMHEISNGVIKSGTPLTEECISDIASSFSVEQSKIPYGVVPHNLLYYDTRRGHERYVWFNGPQKKVMHFVKELGINSGEYHIPGVIYDTNGIDLNIYSFKGDAVNSKSQIYKAPFFNVTNGDVCLGFADIEEPEEMTFENYLKYWENKFWLTEFSHLGGESNPTKSNLVLLTKNSKKNFNEEELVRHRGLTLEKLLNNNY